MRASDSCRKPWLFNDSPEVKLDVPLPAPCFCNTSPEKARPENTAINPRDNAGLGVVHGSNDVGNMGSDDRPVDRGQNQHCEGTGFKLLLARHIFITSKKHVEAFTLDQFAAMLHS